MTVQSWRRMTVNDLRTWWRMTTEDDGRRWYSMAVYVDDPRRRTTVDNLRWRTTIAIGDDVGCWWLILVVDDDDRRWRRCDAFKRRRMRHFFYFILFFPGLLKLSHRKYHSDSQNLLPANRPALDYDDTHTGRRPQLIYLWRSCIGVLYIPRGVSTNLQLYGL